MDLINSVSGNLFDKIRLGAADSDIILVVIVMYILAKENADSKLILALCYIII